MEEPKKRKRIAPTLVQAAPTVSKPLLPILPNVDEEAYDYLRFSTHPVVQDLEWDRIHAAMAGEEDPADEGAAEEESGRKKAKLNENASRGSSARDWSKRTVNHYERNWKYYAERDMNEDVGEIAARYKQYIQEATAPQARVNTAINKTNVDLPWDEINSVMEGEQADKSLPQKPARIGHLGSRRKMNMSNKRIENDDDDKALAETYLSRQKNRGKLEADVEESDIVVDEPAETK